MARTRDGCRGPVGRARRHARRTCSVRAGAVFRGEAANGDRERAVRPALSKGPCVRSQGRAPGLTENRDVLCGFTVPVGGRRGGSRSAPAPPHHPRSHPPGRTARPPFPTGRACFRPPCFIQHLCIPRPRLALKFGSTTPARANSSARALRAPGPPAPYRCTRSSPPSGTRAPHAKVSSQGLAGRQWSGVPVGSGQGHGPRACPRRAFLHVLPSRLGSRDWGRRVRGSAWTCTRSTFARCQGGPQAAEPDPSALPFRSVPAATPRWASRERLCSVAPALRSQVTLRALVAVAVGK